MNIVTSDLNYCIFAIIIIYIPFHLLEEAVGNFPEWMYQHKWIPEKISYGHWMANNLFFYLPLLLLGSIVSFFNPTLSFLGTGILIWGFINFCDHAIYTIIDHKKSPGILTGAIFAVVSVFALMKMYHARYLSLGSIFLSVGVSIAYALLPVLLSMLFHKIFKKIFR